MLTGGVLPGTSSKCETQHPHLIVTQGGVRVHNARVTQVLERHEVLALACTQHVQKSLCSVMSGFLTQREQDRTEQGVHAMRGLPCREQAAKGHNFMHTIFLLRRKQTINMHLLLPCPRVPH